jgi:hypothetical protein
MQLGKKESFYFTKDFTRGIFNRQANFFKVIAENQYEAIVTYLKSEDKKVAVLTNDYKRYCFSECWIKLFNKPDLTQANYIKPFEPSEIEIYEPGTHPGGNRHWIKLKKELELIPILTYKNLKELNENLVNLGSVDRRFGSNDFRIISIV